MFWNRAFPEDVTALKISALPLLRLVSHLILSCFTILSTLGDGLTNNKLLSPWTRVPYLIPIKMDIIELLQLICVKCNSLYSIICEYDSVCYCLNTLKQGSSESLLQALHATLNWWNLNWIGASFHIKPHNSSITGETKDNLKSISVFSNGFC